MDLRIVVDCDHDTNNDINGRHGEIVSYSASKDAHYILCRLDRVDDEAPAVLVSLTVGCVKLLLVDPTPATSDSFFDEPRPKKRIARAK